jgi:hypothetical protein
MPKYNVHIYELKETIVCENYKEAKELQEREERVNQNYTRLEELPEDYEVEHCSCAHCTCK